MWVVIPTAVVTQLRAILRREGKAKRGNGGKEMRRLRTCRIRSELIRSDKSGRVINEDADERRERKMGATVACPLTRPGAVYLYDLSPRE